MAIDMQAVTNRHAVAMRRYVLQQLLEAATVPPRGGDVCDALQCINADTHPTWVWCDVCGRWSHLVCVDLTEVPAGDFICPACCERCC